jgi:hypothetical protein
MTGERRGTMIFALRNTRVRLMVLRSSMTRRAALLIQPAF